MVEVVVEVVVHISTIAVGSSQLLYSDASCLRRLSTAMLAARFQYTLKLLVMRECAPS